MNDTTMTVKKTKCSLLIRFQDKSNNRTYQFSRDDDVVRSIGIAVKGWFWKRIGKRTG